MNEVDPEVAQSETQQAAAEPVAQADPIDAKLAEVAAPFGAPIPGPDPSGENARFDPRHEAIRNEIEKLGRPDGVPADWALVRDDGRALLTEKSKDFLIASYFAVGAYAVDGVRGLVDGLAALSALLEHHWDTGFPPLKRIRARVNAIDWCVERLDSMQGSAASTATRTEVQMLGRVAKVLEERVLQRFEDDAPGIYGLREIIAQIERTVVTEGEPEAPSDAEASPPSPAPVSDGAPTPPTPSAAAPPTAEAAASPVASAAPLGAGLEPLVQPFSMPIPGGAPAGENARHDDAHQAIRGEVEKLGSPTGGEVDWGLVRDQGRTLLTTRSKDFQVASYFAIGAHATEGVSGLSSGIGALIALLQTYWEDGFPPPKRIRARVNAIDWFVDRAAAVVEANPPSGVSRDDISLLSAAAKELERLVLDRFGDEPPNIYGLKETIQRIERAVAEEAPSAPPARAPASAPTPGPGSAQPAPVQVDLKAPTAALADPAQVQQFLRQVGNSLVEASSSLFEASQTDPISYRLRRQGLYMSILRAPVPTQGKATSLPPPALGAEQMLGKLAEAQNWAELLQRAESSLRGTRFWLDLHRYVAVALGGLGHGAAREAVEAETSALVRRLPEVVDLAFNDGQPFASSITREWLGTLTPTSAGGSSASAGATADGESSDFAQTLAEAHSLALGGKLEEAMSMLTRLVESEASSGRSRFLARLAMADACSAGGAPALAEGILAGLCREIERLGLEEWEPKMAERCYRSRYEALAALAGNSANRKDELMDTYRRLCGVAPSAALELGKPPG